MYLNYNELSKRMIDIKFSSVDDPFNVQVNNKKENNRYVQLNSDYHYFFTCGDPDQFVQNIVEYSCSSKIKPKKTFKNLYDTFEYMFDTYKKGILIQIHDNKLVNFLPFSKQNYINDFEKIIRVDPKYGNNNQETIQNFRKMILKMNEGTKYENKYTGIQKNMCEWISGNGLIRYEYPYCENDSGIAAIYHMFKTLCERRNNIPDVTFFVNKRDHAILRKDGNHSYTNLFGANYPIKERYRENMDKFLPILSMNSSDDHLDIAIPTWEDWGRCSSEEFNSIFKEQNKQFTSYPNTMKDLCLDFKEKSNSVIQRKFYRIRDNSEQQHAFICVSANT